LQGKHKVVVTANAKKMFSVHLRFLQRDSLNAAQRLLSRYKKSLARIADNPFQFPIADELDIPSIAVGVCRKCLFEDRYKALFQLGGNEAVIIAVIDSRMENKDALGED